MRVTAGRAACLGERMARCTFPLLVVEGTSEDPMAVESVDRNQDFSSLRRPFMVLLAHCGRRQITEIVKVSVDLKKIQCCLSTLNAAVETFEL